MEENMLPNANELERLIIAQGNPDKATQLAHYFKTAPGQYGEGDVFLGLTAPQSQKIGLQYKNLPPNEVEKLLLSKFHEVRQVALKILVMQFAQADNQKRTEIYDFYIHHTHGINSWDLVDTSAPYILGEHILTSDRKILYQFVTSTNMWEKRIAIVSTATLIRHNQFEDTLKLSRLLLNDSHDLIHKAVGWMLREVGKKNELTLIEFLNQYAPRMHRTTLRYAIERFDKTQKSYFLAVKKLK